MPISEVRELTENASTPAIPTMAMIMASVPNDAMNSALSRRGATVASRTCSSVATFSINCLGSMSRIVLSTAGCMSAGSFFVRMMIEPLKISSCMNG